MEQSEHHRHKIILDLNNAGFKASDLEDIRPDFEDPKGNQRPVCYQWQWVPCAEGPESFRIAVIIYAAIGTVGGIWLNALAEDIYKWAKSSLGQVFEKRRNGSGWTKVQFNDKKIYIDAHPSSEEFADAWLELALRFEELKSLEFDNVDFEKSTDGNWVFLESEWEREFSS